VYNQLHCWILSDYTRTTISRSQEQLPPPIDDEPETDHRLPAVLRQRHRWVSSTTEKKIEEAWGPRGPRQICEVCHMRCPSHRALRLHVDAHFFLHFCPCGFHDVFPYPVIVHRLDCFAGESHVVDKDCFPQYVDNIRPVVKKAITLAALDVGFQTLLITAGQRSPMIRGLPATTVTTDDAPANDETPPRPEKDRTTSSPGHSRLATVEERLLRLQTEFTQLTSVGRLKRRLRARQARHRSQSLQQ